MLKNNCALLGTINTQSPDEKIQEEIPDLGYSWDMCQGFLSKIKIKLRVHGQGKKSKQMFTLKFINWGS